MSSVPWAISPRSLNSWMLLRLPALTAITQNVWSMCRPSYCYARNRGSGCRLIVVGPHCEQDICAGLNTPSPHYQVAKDMRANPKPTNGQGYSHSLFILHLRRSFLPNLSTIILARNASRRINKISRSVLCSCDLVPESPGLHF